jgi:DNA mismatch endonuclease, patch repair protein
LPDNVDAATRSAIMARVRSSNTTPELVVRRALHAAGFRFRLHRKDLPGKPDLTLPRYKTAVFVHGCFWHGHGCKRGRRVPATNRDYWVAKIGRNVERDRSNMDTLRQLGWTPVVIWECRIAEGVAKLIEQLASPVPGDRSDREETR